MSTPLDCTADVMDEEDTNHAFWLRTTSLHSYGGNARFKGKARTVRCFEDNSKVAEMLNGKGNGCVLVVDGGGSVNRALFGDMMGDRLVKNGWAGVVVNGAVRDVAQLKNMPLGVKALGTCPRKSNKRNSGEVDVVLEVFGCVVKPGDFVVCDEDGVVVLPAAAAAAQKAKL